MRTTISSLPRELLEQILTDPAFDEESLYYAALTCSHWTPSALALLYRDLDISSWKRAAALATSSALARYKTSSLRLAYSLPEAYNSDGGESEGMCDLRAIVERCEGLTDLAWESCTVDLRAVEAVLTSPPLSSLKSLTLIIQYEPNLVPILQLSIPFGLTSLKTNLYPSSISLLKSIMDASLTRHPPSLTTLEVDAKGDDVPLRVLNEIIEVAPFLQKLVLSAFDNFHFGRNDDLPLVITSDFVRRATSLSFLSFAVDNNSSEETVTIYLQAIFKVTGPTLTTFRLDIRDPSEDFRSLVVDAAVKEIEDAMAPGLALSNLRRLEFGKITLEQLEAAKGWNNLFGALEAKGVQLFIDED